MDTSRRRRDGLSILFLGMTVVILLLAYLLGRPSEAAMQDFRVLYNPARCLFHQCDPYSQTAVLRLYQSDDSARRVESEADRQIVTRSIYPPSAFGFALPFSLLPWDLARRAWTLVSVGGLLFASFLIWDLAAEWEPVLGGILAGLVLFNSEVVVVLGNPTGIVVCFTIIAVWCFIRERWVLMGILCMVAALAIKPQVPGFIWLYFLLASSRRFRRYALGSLFVAVVLSVPVIAWVWYLSPHWIGEWQANLQFFTRQGGEADPGPLTTGSHGAGAMICLQTVFSLVRDSPGFYNLASWSLFAPLLGIWAWGSLRSPVTHERALLALAAIAPLSLLPVYHHMYDTKLLLLTVPACGLLWQGRSATKWSALLLTGVALLLTGDLPAALIFHSIDGTSLAGPLKLLFERLPVPIVLLTLSIFYLKVFMRSARVAVIGGAEG